ncbi:E3 ubiquitin-protein ligase TRIM11-like [Engystomops pustulosus]|uniref:E3 ubiquitin-protein ligase TRIM11-like n=1 Tax=Engystomops pustulosus TaxID=76066 RepID=UPI003AFA8766
MASADLREELDCSICLTTYTDPVMLRCGHNFCRVCIDRVLDTQDGSGGYSCPECREEFGERPALIRNWALRNVTQYVLSTEPPEEKVPVIYCTYCIHSPVPAVKSCLHCEASLCDDHLKVHSKRPEHVLSDPSTSLENRKSPVHKKKQEPYCTKDAACNCVTCKLDGEHGGHQTELSEEASMKKKQQLRKVLDNLASRKEMNASMIQAMVKHMTDVHERAEVVNQNISELFEGIRSQVNDLEKRVLMDTSRQVEQVTLSVLDITQQLETENEDLSKTMLSIEEKQDINGPLQGKHRSYVSKMPSSTRNDVLMVGDLNTLPIATMLHAAMTGIIQEIDSKGFKMQDISDVFFDVHTAGKDVEVTDFRMVSWLGVGKNRPHNPKTFQSCQVLSKNSYRSGKHYFQVESGGGGDWCVGLSYASIERKGERCVIGYNDKSWGLRLWNGHYSVIHDSKVIQLPVKPSSEKLGLYLDYEAGQLSFYELCDPVTHLYTFVANFVKPLHILCWVMGSSLKFSIGMKLKMLYLRKVLPEVTVEIPDD